MADYREPDVRCVDGIERMARAIYERIVYAGEDVETVLRDYLPRSAYRWETDDPPHCPTCECGGTKRAQAWQPVGAASALPLDATGVSATCAVLLPESSSVIRVRQGHYDRCAQGFVCHATGAVLRDAIAFIPLLEEPVNG